MPEYKNVKICVTFVPSFRLVRQTISDTSSCHIIDQKSAIVLGLGPDNNTIIREKNNVLQILFNRITIQSKKKKITLSGNVYPFSLCFLKTRGTFKMPFLMLLVSILI